MLDAKSVVPIAVGGGRATTDLPEQDGDTCTNPLREDGTIDGSESLPTTETSVPKDYAQQQAKVFMDPMGEGALKREAAKERWSWSTSTTATGGKTVATTESPSEMGAASRVGESSVMYSCKHQPS